MFYIYHVWAFYILMWYWSRAWHVTLRVRHYVLCPLAKKSCDMYIFCLLGFANVSTCSQFWFCLLRVYIRRLHSKRSNVLTNELVLLAGVWLYEQHDEPHVEHDRSTLAITRFLLVWLVFFVFSVGFCAYFKNLIVC